MANRSHLYALGFDRVKEEYSKEKEVHGLSEYPYAIPLSYMILVSQQTRLSPSIIWDDKHPLAIIGDFEQGKQKLFAFVERLIKEDLLPIALLEKQLEETKTFLSKHKVPYMFLEGGEILAMNDHPVELSNEQLFNTIKNIDEECEKFVLKCKDYKEKKAAKKPSFFENLFSSKSKEPKIDSELEQYLNEFGINYWSDVLYYHFEIEKKD